MDPIQVYPLQLHDTEDRSAAVDHHHDDEAPAVKRIVHQFYLVKLQPYEYPELESAIKRAQGVLRRMSKSRAPVVEDFEFRKMDRDKLSWNMNWHCRYRHQARQFVELPWDRNYQTRHLDFLQESLRKLTFDEDWEKQVKELQRRLVHDQRPSQARERKIIKEFDDLLRMKELVDHPSQAEENAKIIERWGSKDEIRQQIEGMQTTEEDREFECLQKQHVIIEKDVRSFEGKLLDINKEKAKAYECILDSTRLQATIRADYDEYVATSKSAKELAMKKDILGLQELINRVNERFMSKWNNEKALFREVYKKRVASSLDSRGFNGDGMLKSPGDQRNVDA